MKHFEFEDKTGSAIIGLPELKATMAIGEWDGKMPASVPLVHHELIEMLMNKAAKANVNCELQPLTIRERYCKKKKDAVSTAPAEYMVNRLAGKILFNDPFKVGADTLNPGIAFTYVYDSTLKGIQVAFGPSVAACDNLTVFGEHSFSTSGKTKLPFDKGLDLLDHWMQNYSAIQESYETKIKALSDIKLTASDVDELIGNLYTKAVRFNAGQDILAPLNQSEVSEMIRAGFDRNTAEKPVTGWDLMNWGTAVLKPNVSDMTNLISNTAAFNDYLYSALVLNK